MTHIAVGRLHIPVRLICSQRHKGRQECLSHRDITLAITIGSEYYQFTYAAQRLIIKAVKYAVILNPVSGNGKSLDVLARLYKWAEKNKVDFRFFTTTAPGDGIKLGKYCRLERFDRVIVVGGDGTVNEVGAALLGSNVVLGVIPGGKGNDFFKMTGANGFRRARLDGARRRQSSRSLDDAFRAAFHGEPRPVDSGTINGRPFFNSVGVGFDAEVAEIVARNDQVSGIAAYLLAVFKAWRNLKPKNIEIDLDGMIMKKEITLVCIGNGRSSGGGFLLTPSARIDDGLFDICVIGALPKSKIIQYLPRTLNGSHIRLEETAVYRSKKVSVRSANPLPVHIDGELMTPRPRRIDLQFNEDRILVATGKRYEK
jgi:YegS/Rv2252/BmrU family lipid kinase